ncbi:E3 ubiquitin-protein ligase RNFT2 [Onthophagus taurus]|uniref:E3 ubiquitin-protein ligase RNFT2 n=1 Tax=Onthophagus taurus TaxID=166361 RepID=UPI000C20135B|nr:RING finger and transmembrane domain-containing protein 2 isoform X1 [Onthophagus taurus]
MENQNNPSPLIRSQSSDTFDHVATRFQRVLPNYFNVTHLIGTNTLSEPNISHINGPTMSQSFVINVEDDDNLGTSPVDAAATTNNINPEPEEVNNVEAVDHVSATERLQNMLEARQCTKILQKYIPFVLILFAKGLYDHHEGILNVIVLLTTFTHANSVVKKEATKKTRKNYSKLLLALLYIVCAIVFIYYQFGCSKLYLNLIFIRTYESSLKVWDLLWIVGVTDFILKLITVVVKIFVTLMPHKIIAFQKRGKTYLFIEAISQLYRSLAPIQPWLFYILESYEGPEKIVGVFLAAAYMVSKGRDLMSKLKLFKNAVLKLLQNVTIGSSPSKEQIQTAGDHCPICHDEYDSPILLHCRHIFCESCVLTWFDREQTCPLCRAKVVDDPSWRDGSTTFFIQLF